MSKLIRRKKEIGAALVLALQLTTLTVIGLMAPFASGPQQSANAPADAQMRAAQTQTQPAQAPTATVTRDALRASAVFATKLYEPLASEIFNLAASRAESARQSAQQSVQGGEAPNGATLTTDQQDYPPFSYVYFTGSGFQPGETVNMIVVELDPIQKSFQPWDVVADENGNFQTSWYVFSEDFIGATFQATATGQSSQLTASATFTDATYLTYENAGHPILRDAFAWDGGTTVYYNANGIATKCHRIDWVDPSNVVVQSTIFAAANPQSDSLVIPASSTSSGVWQVKIYESGANSNCGTATYPTLLNTATFDVARAVVIGAAPSPVPLNGGGDSFVKEDKPVEIHATDTTMDVKPDVTERRRSFLQFDLTSLGIPNGSTVTSAKLRLNATILNSGPRTENVHRVTQSWSESTLDWDFPTAGAGGPSVAGSPTDAQSVSAIPSLVRWNVTSDVNSFFNGTTNHGWRITDA